MAEFECTLCGRCCMGMGRYVRIVGTMGPYKPVVRHELGDEVVYATIDPRFRDDYDPDDLPEGQEAWCPFLMAGKNEDEYFCIIHRTRPAFCRNYRCCSMRILAPGGEEAGKVKGRRSFSSEDEALSVIWENEVAPVSTADDAAWGEEVSRILSRHGYGVEVYD